jgi:hypothetical protein
MSANLYWRPAAKRGTCLSVAAPSSFMEVLGRISPGPPWTLDSSDLDRLRGAAAASNKGVREGFEELIEAIEKHKSVKVEVEY